MKYTYGTPFTHVYDKFEHYLEDIDDCSLCVNFESRKVGRTHGGRCSTPRTQAFAGTPGCGRSVCEFQDLKDEAIRNNRLKRPKGWWNRLCETE